MIERALAVAFVFAVCLNFANVIGRYAIGHSILGADEVQIYIMVGEPQQALDRLEPLLQEPYFLSPGWLRIDPTFEPLKGNPRFEALLK